MKFKSELEKDKSQLDPKEYEAKKAGVKDAQLYKDDKEVAAKLEAPSAYISQSLEIRLDSLCSSFLVHFL